MAASPTIPPPGSDEAAYVRQALGEVRTGNALTIARLRVALRALMVVAFGVALWRDPHAVTVSVEPINGLVVSLCHLAVGLLVLWRLGRGPSEPMVVVGAASDFLSVAIGSWLAMSRPGVHADLIAAYFMAVMQLLLLWSALSLRRELLVPLAAVALAFEGSLVWRAGLGPSDVAAILGLLGVFSVAVVVAGTRQVALAVRASLEARSGGLSRRHAQELRAAKDELEAARARAETLTALLIHDLRNPLASIAANLEVVRAQVEAPSPAFLEAVEVAQAESRRVAAMAGDLLLVARLEDGLEPARSPVVVAPLLADLERSMGPVVTRSGASLRVRSDWAGAASLDEGMVRRLLENLLVNAARHVGPGGRVELAAEACGSGLRLAVRNDGPAVPPEARARLFEKGASHGRREWHQAGLGLHLCALVAARHGGAIGLVDRPGWSVAFEAELPLGEAGGA
jgi:signal transduction histidine kinase